MVAIYYVRAAVAFIIFGLVWYVGNVVLFGAGGVGTALENLQPGYFYEMDLAVKFFWGTVLPILVLASIGLYVIVASQIQEPR